MVTDESKGLFGKNDNIEDIVREVLGDDITEAEYKEVPTID